MTTRETTPPPLLLRSLLFVPGDSEAKLARGAEASADGLILDLEDSVDARRKPRARELVAEFLRCVRPRSSSVWVRINALDAPESGRDIDAVLRHRPTGLVVPKVSGAAELARLGARLDELEPRLGIAAGATKLLPIATETPAAMFALGGYAACGRLAALTWGAEDLGAALGAATTVDERGEWLPPYQLARSLCLFAAAAARVPAIDTVHTAFRDAAGLERQALEARRDGFAGKLAIHPDQLETLARIFSPSPAELEVAREIVAAFAAAPGAGVVVVDGRMLDRPHLERARRVLASEAAAAAEPRREPAST